MEKNFKIIITSPFKVRQKMWSHIKKSNLLKTLLNFSPSLLTPLSDRNLLSCGFKLYNVTIFGF